jgi:thioredoxin 1
MCPSPNFYWILHRWLTRSELYTFHSVLSSICYLATLLAVYARLFLTPTPIEMGHKAIEITDANFEEIIGGDKPVLVDFWAEWCGPCRMVGPVVEELAGEYEGKVVVGKVDVDANPQTSMKFGIRSIPTLLVFKNGQIVDKQVGAVPKHVLAQKLEAQVTA